MFGRNDKKAPLGAQQDEEYELHSTPAASEAFVSRPSGAPEAFISRPSTQEAEIVRRGAGGGAYQVEEGRPVPQSGYHDPRGPPEPAADVTNAAGGRVSTQKDNIISVHGYLHKQGKRTIKGPMHKSWKRRYFALEKAKIFYFHSHLECRQYFTTRNPDLVVGAIELKEALQLRPCARLDLPHKGFEITTKRRIWVLCPETDDEYRLWFEGVEEAIVACGAGNIIERKLPNVRKYYMKGITTYRTLYLLFIITGIAELLGLVFWFVVGLQPCDSSNRDLDCESVYNATPNELTCRGTPFSGWFTPPSWYMSFAGVDDVVCFHDPPIAQWVSYFAMIFAELLTFFLGIFYYLGMWKPVRRGAHYFDEFEPRVPDELWPKVDVFLCHYSEPAEETIDTLMACMNLQYPPHLLQIYVLDDGYCTTKWTKGNPIPAIELNKDVLEKSGDLRQEVAQFMYDRVCDPNEEMEVYAWRKLHSSANLPSPSRPKVVLRADCAVGSFRDDYRYPGLPHVTFIGRVKPEKHFSKAGNINNALYNEGSNGRYLVVLDSDMQPHPKFILATLPFFFDDEDRQFKNKYACCTTGCKNVAKMCCASCKIAGVPEERISYCSKECFENAMHVQSDLHRRQVNGTVSDTRATKRDLRCVNCDAKLGKNDVCRKCNTVNNTVDDDVSILHTYSDDVRDNAVAFVQTPQYFRDCAQLQIGDPLGHRNSTFYDAIQTGQDGYDCAAFAGTNALIRREALDSISGIQYGSLTEDCYTGQKLCSMGWKGLYFRKDFEGEAQERIRLAEGLVPDSVAAAMAQRRRWAKGNFQTLLMKKNARKHIDPEWKRPHVAIPKYRKPNNFMRRVFYFNSTMYPVGSISVILFYYITIYFLYTGYAPIYLSGLRLLIALVPKIIIQGMLSALCNRGVENIDVVRSQESWFVYAFTNCSAMFAALWWKLTGKKTKWVNKRDATRGSFAELPNVLVFFGTVFGIVWAMVRYMVAYYNRVYSHGDSMLCAAVLMGLFIAFKLGASVRMSIQEYFGWSYQSLMDQGNFMGSSSLAVGIVFVVLWVYIEKPASY
ncbi:Cellulose synthase 1, partial [Globisporangium splendens]